ncbi:MAG: response regulator [Acidobacteriota bacterium]
MQISHVLVVDNNRFYTTLIGDHLREKGFTVTEEMSGAGALRALEDRRPDLIILDLIMPEIDGVQVCKYLKSRRELCSIPVIILSGVLVEEIKDFESLGARAFVAKMQAEKVLEGIDRSIEWVRRGEPEVLVGGFQEMHRREVVKELLEELEGRTCILESLSEGAVQINAEDNIVYCNDTFGKMLGQQSWEPLNRSIIECFPEHREQVRALVRGVRATPSKSQRLELQLGERTLEIRASSLRQPDQGGGLVLLIEDRTIQHQVERERGRLQMQFLQNEKLSSLGRLVAGVAHELNNPLTGVIGYSQLLLGRSSDTKLKRQLERIYTQACRCQKVIQNLIVFGRKHRPIKRYLGLNGILTKVLNVLSLQLNLDSIQIVTELDPKLPLTMVDYDQMRQVFMNVINNAHQAMMESDGKVLTVRSSCRDGRIHIEFQDTGPGIPAEIVGKVLDPFFTTREIGKGMGLGLSVSYSVVRSHGGEIHIDSAPGGGARIILDLPVLSPGSSTEADGDRASLPRVLVVDDEPVIVDLMVEILTEGRFRADTASDGLEALRKLSTGSYDAVLLDLKMPEMDGRSLYEQICKQYPELTKRVIFATGDTVGEETRQFLQNCGRPILSKPFEIDRLINTLSTVVQACRSEASPAEDVLETEPA